MSTLYLIRHSQASFGADDYDVLSQRGETQSRHLGTYLAQRKIHLDACYTGPRRRHIDTASIAIDSAGRAGTGYPDCSQLDGLDEYPLFELFEYWKPTLRADYPDIAAKLDGAIAGRIDRRADQRADKRAVETAFGTIMAMWARGELDSGDLESFVQFQSRVRQTLYRIMVTEGRKRRVAVFTSGGPITLAIQMALDLDSEVALRMALVIANSSISEFRYRQPAEFSLVRFNAVPHLADDSLITYR